MLDGLISKLPAYAIIYWEIFIGIFFVLAALVQGIPPATYWFALSGFGLIGVGMEGPSPCHAHSYPYFETGRDFSQSRNSRSTVPENSLYSLRASFTLMLQSEIDGVPHQA